MARVLVIDDSPTIFLALKSALSEFYSVDKLDRFVDLPQCLRERPPDIILLDLDMPALPGVSFGKYVRKYQAREIPIIIHSSHAYSDMERAAEQVGAVAVLQKGEPTEKLLRLLESLVRPSFEARAV